ncbi:MAG: histidine kinase [Lysobacterales bacterium 14-68-21]|nr:MAG: histidine kinase [Xanthomonadales bacterium 15-68-25]OZB66667.1 MAG: histidine kinase [Xanthomonadales bacterium 14-68-21]
MAPRPPGGGEWPATSSRPLAAGLVDALTWAGSLGSVRMIDVSRPQPPPPWRKLGDYLFASVVALLGFALAFVAQRYLSVANLALVFLTAVLVVAVRTRMAVAVYTALLCFVGYNFFFTEPRYTLAIERPDDVLAVGLFLAVALVCSRLATRLSTQVEGLREAQWRARALLDLGKRLAGCGGLQAVRDTAVVVLARTLSGGAMLFAPDARGALAVVAATAEAPDLGADALAAASWVAAHARPAGRYEADFAGIGCWLLPVDPMSPAAGVVALSLTDEDEGPDMPRRELALAMLADIARVLERARLAEALEQARVQAETERLRNALLSSVSHDLRSPLAAMIGAAGTLASYDDQLAAAERGELLQSILDEGQRLDRYIQNLLDMTRLGHGTLKLQRDWVDATEIVLAAIGRLRRYHPEQAVETHLPEATVLLYVHPALIEQALFNVLENAAHFSPPGAPVTVDLAVEGDRLAIRVADRGPGIPEAERARIFDMFYSVSRGDRGHKGTGLGLSICRGMVGAHGGSVEALPAEGGGTVIRIVLPLPPAPEPGP